MTTCGTGAPELALSVSRVQILAETEVAEQLTPDPRRGASHDPPRAGSRLGQMFLNPNRLFYFSVTQVKKMRKTKQGLKQKRPLLLRLNRFIKYKKKHSVNK